LFFTAFTGFTVFLYFLHFTLKLNPYRVCAVWSPDPGLRPGLISFNPFGVVGRLFFTSFTAFLRFLQFLRFLCN
jgi:hypothetical protein